MRRLLRTPAAVLAGLALVAALPEPCGCASERSASKAAREHACCAPPAGVSAADEGCCDESPEIAGALPSSAVSPDAAPPALATLPVAAPSAPRASARPTIPPAPSPPPAVLRI